MSSPIIPETKDSSFSAIDHNSIIQDDEQQQHLKDYQNPLQSPNTIVTLEIPDADEPNHDDLEEITPISPTISDSETSSTFALVFCRGGGGRKKRNPYQEKKSQEKLESLASTLNLIPFIPVKSLDFSSHEDLLKRLGLWDFAHLDFNFNLRNDLILQLIANFNPSNRSSKVNEVRIKVSRSDLARALSIPVKKRSRIDSDLEAKESEASVSFIRNLFSSFILLEDTWMMTDDIMNTMNLIKEGSFEKVDFAKLIWVMVEKELSNSELENCYYASHLQLLIKSQREDLFKEQEPVKMESDFKDEERNIELSLSGLDNSMKEDDMKLEQENDENNEVDFEESKEDEQRWYNNTMDGNFLQQYNLAGEFEEIKQEEEEENDEGGEFDEKDDEEVGIVFGRVAIEGTESENLIEAIEASQNPFSSMPGGSGIFNNGNGSKRAIGHLEIEMPHQSLNKRIRVEEHWDNLKPSSDFDIYMDHIQHTAGKARMLYNAKDQAIHDLKYQNQMLVTQLEQRDNLFNHSLAKFKMEEQHKREIETNKLERELYMMENLLEGYRKALKETKRSFAEYRKTFPLPEEPIYRDTGSGGLVLSKSEFEKLRLKREEEERLNRLLIERKIKQFEAGWIAKLEEYETVVVFMGDRVSDLEKRVDFCKERVARRKGSQKSEEQVTRTTNCVEV